MYKSCIVAAWQRDPPANRRAEPALRRQPGAAARLGAPLRPARPRLRSSGGLRLYSLDELTRVRRMQANLAQGLAAAEAAALARQDECRRRAGPALQVDAARAELADALAAFDEPRAQAILDRAARRRDRRHGRVRRRAALPARARRPLGTRRGLGRAGALRVQRAARAAARAGSRLGTRPRAARRARQPAGRTPRPGPDRLRRALRARGWRVAYLGADTPIESIAEAARAARPRLIVVSAVGAEPFAQVAGALRQLAAEYSVYLGGAGAAAVDW